MISQDGGVGGGGGGGGGAQTSIIWNIVIYDIEDCVWIYTCTGISI